MAADGKVEILMYHSISDGHGPTNIAPDIFAGQMDALADAGYHVAGFEDLIDWHSGRRRLPERTAVITFDDAFTDFRNAAWPVLKARNFPATVFVPAAAAGGNENWQGADEPARSLLDWPDIKRLAGDGVQFGSHSLSHPHLTRLGGDELEREVAGSKERLEEILEMPVRSFAPPYGDTNGDVRSVIEKHYELAAGVEFGRASRQSDIFNLPRIEMHYFRNVALWRRYLDGRAELYFNARRLARKVRRMAYG